MCSGPLVPVEGRPAFGAAHQKGSDGCTYRSAARSPGPRCAPSRFFDSESSCLKAGLVLEETRSLRRLRRMSPRERSDRTPLSLWTLPRGREPLPQCPLPASLPLTEMRAPNQHGCVCACVHALGGVTSVCLQQMCVPQFLLIAFVPIRCNSLESPHSLHDTWVSTA